MGGLGMMCGPDYTGTSTKGERMRQVCPIFVPCIVRYAVRGADRETGG